ncbi:hypothetical protein G7Y89_g13574 [Cudoniella acicularis]|uniref:Peptidase M24 domain-containing protein n=1 Tax=Cudoniella acicularis TaxID=354080 RepID=A0A8H4VWA8_9HELO|nr:hypothetical protein G7Y89_g13574 [Cudoniella acicularis]
MSTNASEKNVRQPLLAPGSTAKHSLRVKNSALRLLVLPIIVTVFWIGTILIVPGALRSSVLSTGELEKCAWKTLRDHVTLLDVAPITRQEFLQRQSILSAALEKAGVDAFIAEPSASSSYYANISSSYDLSERPFLMIIDKEGHFSYLAPKFELRRIASLDMVFEKKTVIEWGEEESPYAVLRRDSSYKKVMLDEHVRFMIASGLQEAEIEVVPTSQTIQSLRSVKSEAELKILRGINQFTLELVRSLQKCIRIGMSQSTITSAAHTLFTRAGVGRGFWAIVLFGDQAANPHGGSLGKTLGDGEFVLIDIGSKLHNYGSDVTRTILPSKSKVSSELTEIWNTVYSAQSAAVELMRVNETCSVVDAASRKVIADKGFGEFFTHRLGHGLGLEMHEHPYLNGANDEKLKAGQVVTNEPGIYVTTEQARKLNKEVGFGVRLEDAIIVTAEGGIVTTGSRAKSPYEP